MTEPYATVGAPTVLQQLPGAPFTQSQMDAFWRTWDELDDPKAAVDVVWWPE